MRIRFYHLWVYRLFFWVWTPIFRARPDIHQAFVQWGQGWIDRREAQIKEKRDAFHVVEK